MSDERNETQDKTPESKTDQTPAGTVLPDPNTSINSENRPKK
jgi:hypothetical protein